MIFHSVEMLDALPTEQRTYDLAVFSSGFEARSTHVPKLLQPDVAFSTVVLGFRDGLGTLSREENDRYYLERYQTTAEIPQLGGDEHCLADKLRQLIQVANGRPLRVLIDYSVMTRSWYASLLTWARFENYQSLIEFDFVYAYGRYLAAFDPLAISEVVSIPGFEGISGGFRSTAAIFGLGYDKYATLAVYDRLEPDSVYCCIAQRFEEDPNSQKVLLDNAVLLESANGTFFLPLGDIASAFRLLAERVSLLGENNHIVLVPMGPKTHVLAALLVGLRMPWIACLHAKGTRVNPVQVEAAGDLSIARVRFVPGP